MSVETKCADTGSPLPTLRFKGLTQADLVNILFVLAKGAIHPNSPEGDMTVEIAVGVPVDIALKRYYHRRDRGSIYACLGEKGPVYQH